MEILSVIVLLGVTASFLYMAMDTIRWSKEQDK